MARSVQVSAANLTLFHVAARETPTGDALLAWRLAQASGMTDPWLTDFATVTIPSGPSPPGDGLPPY